MATDFTPIRRALEGLTDIELKALAIATRNAPPVAPSLLAWIDSACYWEMNRRVGSKYDLSPPEAAIDPSENAISIDATYAMQAAFAARDSDNGALTFFDALVERLTGAERKQ